MVESILILLLYVIFILLVLYLANWAFLAMDLPQPVRVVGILLFLIIGIAILAHSFGLF